MRARGSAVRIDPTSRRQLAEPSPECWTTDAIAKQEHSRWWEVRDADDELVCLTVYRKGAREVVRRLAA